MANTDPTPSVLSRIQFDTAQVSYHATTLLISAVLVLAAIILALTIVGFRIWGKIDLSQDILLAALALSLATAGIALSALANGMRTRLILEASSIEAQHIKAIELIELRQKLLAAISDRLGKIVISPATCPLDPATNKTAQITWKCLDKSDQEFKPDEEVFKLTWHSNAPAVATVDGNGMVTRMASGPASVTAHFNGFHSNTSAITCT